MDPEISKLITQVADIGKTLLDHAKTDTSSPEARHAQRELLHTSRRLTNALQNQGQIVEGYLYGVCQLSIIIYEKRAKVHHRRSMFCC